MATTDICGLVEQQIHHARIGNIDQAQVECARPARHRKLLLRFPVDGNDITHASAVSPVVHRTQAVTIDLHVVVEPPVINRKHQVLIDNRGIVFLDDQYTRQGPGPVCAQER